MILRHITITIHFVVHDGQNLCLTDNGYLVYCEVRTEDLYSCYTISVLQRLCHGSGGY
jgi:hypothetical protein